MLPYLAAMGTTGTTLTVANNLTLMPNSIIELAPGSFRRSFHVGSIRGVLGRSTPAQMFTFINSEQHPAPTTISSPGWLLIRGTEAGWTITNSGFAGTFELGRRKHRSEFDGSP